MAIGLAEAGADIIGVSASLEPRGSDIENEVKNWAKHLSLIKLIFQKGKASMPLLIRCSMRI